MARTPIFCKVCGRERQHCALKMCQQCYRRQSRLAKLKVAEAEEKAQQEQANQGGRPVVDPNGERARRVVIYGRRHEAGRPLFADLQEIQVGTGA